MKYTLPKLPYNYNGLEPYIDEETIKIHHDKHHLGYVNGLNKAEEQLNEARNKRDYSLIKHLERDLSFNASGDILHTIYWENMIPGGKRKPIGELACRIDRDFGSFINFKNQFSEVATTIEGSGWAVLVWSKNLQRLQIIGVEKHQNLNIIGSIPLLVLDVWEHAYYLKYQNKRAEYIKNWWNLVNWDDVETKYLSAL
ncbi:superoxide dismutase [Clostridium sediminicola]|uniref:superoxide dismutase n=1 Tax=Clostridium sediminicola TaxID=3114879 RepID=UPI0031F251A5